MMPVIHWTCLQCCSLEDSTTNQPLRDLNHSQRRAWCFVVLLLQDRFHIHSRTLDLYYDYESLMVDEMGMDDSLHLHGLQLLMRFVQPFVEKYTISDFEYIVRYTIYIYIYTPIFTHILNCHNCLQCLSGSSLQWVYFGSFSQVATR